MKPKMFWVRRNLVLAVALLHWEVEASVSESDSYITTAACVADMRCGARICSDILR